jgi:type II pantothenate kinase
MEFERRQLALAEGILAGNVFDWGAGEITKLIETQTFGFKEATERLQGALIFAVFHLSF